MKIIIDFSWIIPFFNSPFFTAIATFLTGFAAYIVYSNQKGDEKVNAARIILSEIRNAEEGIESIRQRLDTIGFGDFPSVLPINNWRKYQHLFAMDLDQDEIELINLFYAKCEAIEDYVKRDNNFFWITTEERARVIQQELAKIVVSSAKDGKVDDDILKQLKSTFLDKFSNEGYSYSPRKTIDNLKVLVSSYTKITTSTCGEKIKKSAKLK